ncbi:MULTISPECIES: DNA polymerase IV [unclassified Paracoccus (in: a-proteobacteria)]|uniref:DNA polymerase IV n=1 Tax=unclassified Paracoccus (in: a-proteobacteria) TaxID=2688777 RepID=UPI0021E18997|nr:MULTISPECIES: DNA polymerase IV [unclassified Paracoccus (in: a-proteobacteria)]UXU76050.1 DNA polymerase IV [Paracoccus sp. SMMA_5]UXU81961.1 DNA polymerase IV [Paracoccus sp. SMMA_5_TC]
MTAPPGPAGIRRIVHVDMDAFFASVEQRDDPRLRGLPVAVGGIERGVVAAASYEARRFGVRSAMPSRQALRLCPDLVFVKPRFDVYRAVSRQIREIFAEYTPLIEPLSLDEAYLDLTDHLHGRTATRIAQEIRARIRAATGLTASAGVSYNKFLAKLASDQRKPDGLFVIPPEAGPDFIHGLPIGRFHGIGPATAARMQAHGIHTGADLARQSLEFLTARFGKSGNYYWNIARGIDNREVRPDRIRKSIGAENTYFQDLRDLAAAETALAELAEKVWRHASNAGRSGRTVTLKVKYGNFRQITRARTLPVPAAGPGDLLAVACELLGPVFHDPHGVRLLGITLSGLQTAGAVDAPRQLGLFDQA